MPTLLEIQNGDYCAQCMEPNSNDGPQRIWICESCREMAYAELTTDGFTRFDCSMPKEAGGAA